ncbi:SCO family protein [bacterium]|nr:SCO family protein [bacterium]
MKTTRLLSVWIGLLVLTVSGSLPAQEPTSSAAKVGIDEQVGEVVPGQITFADENGKPVIFGDLIDKPTILVLVYFECPAICGPLLNGVMSLVDEMDLAPGKDYQIVAVSFNEREDSEMAARKQQNFLSALKKDVPPSAWRFLTGNPDNIATLTNATGFRFERVETDGRIDFNHPATLIVLSPERVITGYIRGISFVPDDVALAISEAKIGRVRPTRSSVGPQGLLSFCFTYDPVQQKRVMNITRVAGVATLALAGVFIALVLIIRTKPTSSDSRGES